MVINDSSVGVPEITADPAAGLYTGGFEASGGVSKAFNTLGRVVSISMVKQGTG